MRPTGDRTAVMAALGLVLVAAAVVGTSALALMLGFTLRHVRRPDVVPSEWPGISVPKPLCGADDELAANIASFAELPYRGEYEVVLGVRSAEDPAWRLAEEAVRRWPLQMRLVRRAGSSLVPLARTSRSRSRLVTGFPEKSPALHGPAAPVPSDLGA